MITATSEKSNTKSKWISIRHAVRVLNGKNVSVSRTTVDRWLENGQIHYIELPNGRRLVDLHEIERIATPRIAKPRQYA